MEQVVYILYDSKQKLHRVGKTKNTDISRVKSQLSYYPNPLLYFLFYTTNCTSLETKTLRYLKKNRVNGDWFTGDITKTIEFLSADNTVTRFDFPSFRTIIKSL